MAKMDESGDRRPIATRRHAWVRRLVSRLVNRGVSPNAISVMGMICCLLAGIALAGTAQVEAGWIERGLWVSAALLIQARLLANMLDGMVAIESGQASPVGELFNEVPDRISDAAVFIGLGYAIHSSPTLGYLAAIAAILTAYIRVQARLAGAPADFGGPMAKQHRMFVGTVLALLMAVLPMGWRPMVADGPYGLPALALLVILAGSAATCIRRLAGAAGYLRGHT